jgi:hypothetical protein
MCPKISRGQFIIYQIHRDPRKACFIQHVYWFTMQVSCVVAYWTHVQVVMGSDPGQVKNLLFHATAMLLYIVQIISVPELCISLSSITIGPT